MKTIISALMLLIASPVMSQLYHDESQPGHGITLHSSDAGTAAIWYTYSPEGDQTWLISDTGEFGQRLDLFYTTGLFPARNFDLGDPIGWIQLDRDGDGLRVRYWIELWSERCDGNVPPGPAPPVCAGTLNMTRLAD